GTGPVLGPRRVRRGLAWVPRGRVREPRMRRSDGMPVEFSVTLQDRPGTLVRLGQMLGEAAVNIEAIQGTSREGHAFVRFVPRDPQQASAMIGRPVREPRTGLPGFGRTEMSVDSSFDNLIRSQQQ